MRPPIGKAARDAYLSATIADVVPAPALSPPPIDAATRTLLPTRTLWPPSDDQLADMAHPMVPDVSRTVAGNAPVTGPQTAGALGGAVRPWGPAAPPTEPAIAMDAITAGAAAEPVAVMATVADVETDEEWEVGVVDVAARLSRRQVGDTAPEFLMRAPPSVGLTADAFFDGLARRVESDR